jgi:hypothetical protein
VYIPDISVNHLIGPLTNEVRVWPDFAGDNTSKGKKDGTAGLALQFIPCGNAHDMSPSGQRHLIIGRHVF